MLLPILIPYFTNMLSVRVIFWFVFVFGSGVFLVFYVLGAFVRYEMIIANTALRWLSLPAEVWLGAFN